QQLVEAVADGDGGDFFELVQALAVGGGFGDEGAAWDVVGVDAVAGGVGPFADLGGDAAVGGGAGCVAQVDEDVRIGQRPGGAEILVDFVDELPGVADAVERVVFGF